MALCLPRTQTGPFITTNKHSGVGQERLHKQTDYTGMDPVKTATVKSSVIHPFTFEPENLKRDDHKWASMEIMTKPESVFVVTINKA